jgi:hypothetical protein
MPKAGWSSWMDLIRLHNYVNGNIQPHLWTDSDKAKLSWCAKLWGKALLLPRMTPNS